MLVPVKWLEKYVDIDIPLDNLCNRLTLAGLEVGGLEQIGDWWEKDKILVGQVSAVKAHPDADRLCLVVIDYGDGRSEEVVTGAPNLFEFRGNDNLPTLKIAYATDGAVLLDAYTDKRPRPKAKLKPKKIRGVLSKGMVCSELELGLSDEHEGVLILPEDAPLGTPLSDYMGDAVIDLELTPDMARCLSMIGVAREVSALTGAKLKLPEDACKFDGNDKAGDYAAVEIKNPELCNRYTGMMICDVTIGPSPEWMQELLRKAGIKPISNVVDITNYVMLEYGQPLHAFDYDVLLQRAKESGEEKPTIIVRTATPGSKFTTLDDVERNVGEKNLMIADTLGDIAVAGVMGGLNSEISDETVNVLLESATFEGINNRRTTQHLKLNTEASHRFTRGVPATLNDIAARRAAELIREYAGGRIVPGIIDTYPVKQPQVQAFITPGEIQRQLGLAVDAATIRASLKKLDFVVEEKSADDLPAEASDMTFGLSIRNGEPLLLCTAPWHRLDIKYPADLTEEVARMIGYNAIPETLLSDPLPPQRRNVVIEREDEIRDILVGCGLQETINYSLTSIEQHAKLHLVDAEDPEIESKFIVLQNPISPARRVLRRSLLVSALENLAYNLRYTNRMATFELGLVYLPEASETIRPKEERRLCIALTGDRPQDTLHQKDVAESEYDFFDGKGIFEAMLSRLGFAGKNLRFQQAENQPAFTLRCADIVMKGENVGVIGELHPAVAGEFGLAGRRITLIECCIEQLIQADWKLSVMDPISSYPAVVEDLAFVVNKSVTAQDLKQVIERAGGQLLSGILLYDVYEGEPLEDHQKSVAFKLTYQSHEGTLSDEDIVPLRNRIIKKVAKTLEGSLRT